jgi:hypothetical protein
MCRLKYFYSGYFKEGKVLFRRHKLIPKIMVIKEFTISKDEVIKGVFKKDYIDTCLSLEKIVPEYQCEFNAGNYYYTVKWESEEQWNKFLNRIQILGYITLENE